MEPSITIEASQIVGPDADRKRIRAHISYIQWKSFVDPGHIVKGVIDELLHKLEALPVIDDEDAELEDDEIKTHDDDGREDDNQEDYEELAYRL